MINNTHGEEEQAALEDKRAQKEAEKMKRDIHNSSLSQRSLFRKPAENIPSLGVMSRIDMGTYAFVLAISLRSSLMTFYLENLDYVLIPIPSNDMQLDLKRYRESSDYETFLDPLRDGSQLRSNARLLFMRT